MCKWTSKLRLLIRCTWCEFHFINFPPTSSNSKLINCLFVISIKKVFERGLKAIPLSIDLWIHYLTHVKQKHLDDRESIRVQFERALEGCGLEFRSDKLWEGFIKWENEDKNFLQIVAIYDRLLATPTQGYKNHMER